MFMCTPTEQLSTVLLYLHTHIYIYLVTKTDHWNSIKHIRPRPVTVTGEKKINTGYTSLSVQLFYKTCLTYTYSITDTV